MTRPPRRSHNHAGNYPGQNCTAVRFCGRPAIGSLYRHASALNMWQRIFGGPGPVYYCHRHVTHAVEKTKGHTR